MILKAIFAAKEYGMNLIYTLPTDNFVQNFVPPKVDTMIRNNPYLAKNVEGGVYLKKVGQGGKSRFIYFMGAHNPQSDSKRDESSKGVAVSSDLNIHDEASRSDQFIISQMESRTANSKYRGKWLFDNPTYPNMGADSVYKLSDQRHWMVKCSHCNYWQYLDWFRLDKHDFQSGSNHCWIDIEKNQMVCGKCQKALTNYDRINGRWVAKYPKVSEYRGYWLNQLAYVQHSVESILREEEDQKKPKSQFYNMVLGKPYIGSEVKISRQNIIDNHSLNKNDMQNVAMGVDQGNIKWYVIGNETGIFMQGSTESWDEIEKLRNRFNATMVVDGLPDQRETKKLVEKYPFKIWRAIYKPDTDQRELVQFGSKNQPHMVYIRRDEVFDEIVDDIMQANLPIQVPMSDLTEFINHWEAMTRVVEEDSEGNQRFKWIETSDDHFAHATLYWWVAMKKIHKGRLEQISLKKSNFPGASLHRPTTAADIIKDFEKQQRK